MGVRLNDEYVATRFNPTAYGWEPTADEVQIRDGFTADDIAGLRAIQNRYGRAHLYTWTRGDQTVTLAMVRDWYVHAAVIDGVMSDSTQWIDAALDLLDKLQPREDATEQVSTDDALPDYAPRGYDAMHVDVVERMFQEDAVAASSSSGTAYVAVVNWAASSDCDPIIAAADDPHLALVRLVQVFAADAKAGHLADHVGDDFLAQYPVPELPDEVDENSPAIFEADQWLTALGECSTEPYITFHKTDVAARAGDLDAEWGLTRSEIETLVKLAAIAGREFDTVGTGTDYDAFDLALATFGRDRDQVREIARRAFARVVERTDVA
jgi:hypothetical protein